MRPVYETEAHRAVERVMVEWLRQRWKCEFAKLPKAYNLDYAAVRGDTIVGWCEFKQRHHAMWDYETTFLSLLKVMAARNLWEASGVKSVFVVKFEDCWAYADILKARKVGFGGRVDRSDPQDQEPLALIPNEDFILIT